MFSKEFMKFLMEYQKDEFAPKEASAIKEIRFKNRRRGKLAEVLIMNK